MTQPLRNSAGVIVGACDSGFDIFGRRPWRPRERPAAVAVDRDPTVEIDLPRMQSVIPGYTRLR
jgi:hypothetical protein